MLKFLPSYVGSKSSWIQKLAKYKGRHFVEAFAGSAVISANLAGECVLNDLDPYVYKILSRFDELIVPDEFTAANYFAVRNTKEWWKYAYCLQKMSFSGVFRYSKNGYNVPIKNKNGSINIRPEYDAALNRWKTLKPVVLNRQYYDLYDQIRRDSVLILDPPYEGSVASYNAGFDSRCYWEWVRLSMNMCQTVIIFDKEENMPFDCLEEFSRKSRVNGKHSGSNEVMYVHELGQSCPPKKIRNENLLFGEVNA